MSVSKKIQSPMTTVLLATAVMEVLTPVLTSVGEKAAEKIGEKLAEKALECSLWQKIKGLFASHGNTQVIESIENESIATLNDQKLIEAHLLEGLKNNTAFKNEVNRLLQTNRPDMFIVELLCDSLVKDKVELTSLFEERRNAGRATAGDLENMIGHVKRRMAKDRQELISLIIPS
jgi:hypothetical protein